VDDVAEPQDIALAAGGALAVRGDDRLDGSGPVAEGQLEPITALAAPARVHAAHHEGLVELTSVGEVPHSHRATKIKWGADALTWRHPQS
jgi:hypothetical protein